MELIFLAEFSLAPNGDLATMPALPAFDYSQGSAFVHEGYLYYSPNCKRPVVISPRPDTTTNPFRAPQLAASQFRQPVWWSSNWGWLAFVPLQPTFTSLPFEPFSWMPPIINFYATIRNSAGIETQQRRFKMADDISAIWAERENQIVEAANIIRLKHSIQSIQPPLPSSFGFARAHRSYGIAKKMILVSRSWFGILMGWFASIVAEAEVSPFRKTVSDNTLLPYWYRFLMNEGMSLAWLDGLQSSPVGSYSVDILRAGVVIPWADDELKRPLLNFFFECNIPLFFPWSSREEEQVNIKPSLAYLRPPNELIQKALTFLTTSPNGLPLAAYTMQCFFRRALEDNPLTKETLRVLRIHYASSSVLKFVLQHFLTVEDELLELEKRSDRNEAVLREIDAIPKLQRAAADTAASLPQQPMLDRPSADAGTLKGVIMDWKEFFRSRARRHAEWLSSASETEKNAYENHKQHPPTVHTKMFVWETVETPGSMTVYMRNRQTRATFADLIDDDDERVYDAWTNEWDFFPDFVKDDQAESETGVPALCLAPPVDLRPMMDPDDDDHEDEYNEFQPLSPDLSHAGTSTSACSQPSHNSSDSQETSLTHPCSMPMGVSVTHDTKPVEDHPEVSKDMEQTLYYMYGWARSFGAQLPPSHPSLDWRGVQKVLGFASPPAFQESEKLSIINFISVLARGTKFVADLPADLHDLDPRSHVFLGGLYDFRNVLRLGQKMFIFHSPASTACDWVLGTEFATVALYIIRFLVANHRQTILTVGRHLLERGIPFRTLVYLRAIPCNPTKSLDVPYVSKSFRDVEYHFTVPDFESSLLTSKSLLHKIGRVALLKGGILARIAREFLSIDTPLDGPSGWATVDRNGFSVSAESNGCEYWDDELTEDEIGTICGTYTLYTGYGTQTKTVSWLPPPSSWDMHGFGWFEWTEASENFFVNLVAKIRRGDAQPRSRREWRDAIRGFGATRNLIDANHLRARDFLDQYCSVRERI